MACCQSRFSFGDLNEYCNLDVFKYLGLEDRVRFERVDSQRKKLIRSSTTILNLGKTEAIHLFAVIDKYPNLQTLILPSPDTPVDFARLGKACPKLVKFQWGNHGYSEPMHDNELVEFCSALDGNALVDSFHLKTPSGALQSAAKKCPNLSRLVIENLNADSAVVLPIADQIRQLNVRRFSWNADIAKKFKNLNKLTLYALTKNNAVAVMDLIRDFKLQEFRIQQIANDVDFSDVKLVTGLTSLSGSFFAAPDVFCRVLSTLIVNNAATLQTLWILDAELLLEALLKCSRLKLIAITFKNPKIVDEQMESLMKTFKNNTGLRKLHLDVDNLDDFDWKGIFDVCPKLRHFVLHCKNPVVPDHLELVEPILFDYAKRHPKRPIKITVMVDYTEQSEYLRVAKQIDNLSFKRTSRFNGFFDSK